MLAGVLADRFSALPEIAEPAFRAAALTIPVAALAFTYMGATRGLKIMRFTLYSQWIAQPIGWIVLALALWSVSRTAGMTSLAFGASWALALAIAWFGWQKESAPLPARAHRHRHPRGGLGARSCASARSGPRPRCSASSSSGPTSSCCPC